MERDFSADSAGGAGDDCDPVLERGRVGRVRGSRFGLFSCHVCLVSVFFVFCFLLADSKIYIWKFKLRIPFFFFFFF